MKARRRSNGELVDIVIFSGSSIRTSLDFVSFIDSKGVEHDRESLNYYWDFEPIETSPIETSYSDHWQDVRERAAIAAMQGMLANPELIMSGSEICYRWSIELVAVNYADKLVERLKKE